MRQKKQFEWTPKVLLIVFTGICGILIAISGFFPNSFVPFANVTSSVILPMQKGVNAFGIWVQDKKSTIDEMKKLQEENATLKQKVEEVTLQNRNLKQRQNEMERLKELLALSEEYKEYPTVGANIISKGSGNWFNIFVIDKGEKDGIKKDMNVIADGGLVGIVTEVEKDYSKVRSIIEDNSNVSALISSTEDSCIVKGNTETIEKDYIDVDYISKDVKIKDGDEVVTSHISSKYLDNILIGYISDAKLDSNNLTQSAKLTPVVDFKHLREVLVITQLKQTVEIDEE